jgi:SAM-dependent methyltransferase
MTKLFPPMRHLLKLFSNGKYNINNIYNSTNYSPDINLVSAGNMVSYIHSYLNQAAQNSRLTFLDVGGRNGEFSHWATGFQYLILEIEQAKIATNDVVFSNNVFEHLKEPWKAAENCVRITKPGGLLIHFAPFSWRYHPVPVDYFRFSHQGLSSLFLRTGLVEQIESGYDISCRRQDRRGGKLINNLDTPPIDELGGWRENWMTVFVGRKL